MGSKIPKRQEAYCCYIIPSVTVSVSGGIWGKPAYEIVKESTKYKNAVTLVDTKRNLRARTNNLLALLKLGAIPGTELAIEVEELPREGYDAEVVAQRFYELISTKKFSFNVRGH